MGESGTRAAEKTRGQCGSGSFFEGWRYYVNRFRGRRQLFGAFAQGRRVCFSRFAAVKCYPESHRTDFNRGSRRFYGRCSMFIFLKVKTAQNAFKCVFWRRLYLGMKKPPRIGGGFPFNIVRFRIKCRFRHRRTSGSGSRLGRFRPHRRDTRRVFRRGILERLNNIHKSCFHLMQS